MNFVSSLSLSVYYFEFIVSFARVFVCLIIETTLVFVLLLVWWVTSMASLPSGDVLDALVVRPDRSFLLDFFSSICFLIFFYMFRTCLLICVCIVCTFSLIRVFHDGDNRCCQFEDCSIGQCVFEGSHEMQGHNLYHTHFLNGCDIPPIQTFSWWMH